MIAFKVSRFRQLLIEELAIKYNISEYTAKQIVLNSTVNKMLSKSPDFIMHYSIEDNAEEIWNEYVGVPMKPR